MSTVAAIAKKQSSPLERLVGEDARIVSTEHIAVSNFIQAEWLEVRLPEDDQPEEQGRIHLFPVDDERQCLQLYYLQYAETGATNAAVFSLRFLPAFFDQYPADTLADNPAFRLDTATEQQFTICTQSAALLGQFQQSDAKASLIRSLQHTEAAMQLLRRALGNITVPITDSQVPACRFLAYDSEREKIQQAIFIIRQHIDQPHTIRELSRKVAMNECYLKKGFKTVTGKTIHEYQQELRISKAKELLQQQGRSVTDVANTLGYSSISHFSTAFKRVTGMKPCELLA